MPPTYARGDSRLHLPAYLLDATGHPIDRMRGAELLGVPVTPPINAIDRTLRDNVLNEIQFALGTDDPRVLAWWVAIWTAPLSVNTFRALARHLGTDYHKMETRAFRVGVVRLFEFVREARVARCLAQIGSGRSTTDVAALAGLRTPNALVTLLNAAGYSAKRDDVPTSYGLALRYRRQLVASRVVALRNWMPFTVGDPLPRSLRAQYVTKVHNAEQMLARARRELAALQEEQPVVHSAKGAAA